MSDSSCICLFLPGQPGICKQKSCCCCRTGCYKNFSRSSANFLREVTPGDVNLAIEFLSTSSTRNSAADVDHAGSFAVPVISAHGIGDATVFVEGSKILRQRMPAAGNGQRPTAGVKLCGFSRA